MRSTVFRIRAAAGSNIAPISSRRLPLGDSSLLGSGSWDFGFTRPRSRRVSIRSSRSLEPLFRCSSCPLPCRCQASYSLPASEPPRGGSVINLGITLDALVAFVAPVFGRLWGSGRESPGGRQRHIAPRSLPPRAIRYFQNCPREPRPFAPQPRIRLQACSGQNS